MTAPIVESLETKVREGIARSQRGQRNARRWIRWLPWMATFASGFALVDLAYRQLLLAALLFAIALGHLWLRRRWRRSLAFWLENEQEYIKISNDLGVVGHGDHLSGRTVHST